MEQESGKSYGTLPVAVHGPAKGGGIFQDPKSALLMFPAMFTLFNIAVFLTPIWITYHAGKDKHVQQWISSYTWNVVFLVVLWPLAHFVHYIKGAPIKLVVVICLMAQSITLLIASNYVMIEAYKVGSALMAEGCRAYVPKLELENDFVQAKTFYAECMSETIRTSNISSSQAMEQYRIQDCTTYEKMTNKFPNWLYLRYLEENFQCAGWCTEDEPLWTGAPARDACSTVVAEDLFNNIQTSMLQVLVYSSFVLIVVSVTLLYFDPILRNHGLDWDYLDLWFQSKV